MFDNLRFSRAIEETSVSISRSRPTGILRLTDPARARSITRNETICCTEKGVRWTELQRQTMTREHPRAATLAAFTAVHALATRLAALHAQVKALEAAPKAMQHGGVWREGSTFERNDVVTCDGSVYICKQQTTAKPGSPDDEGRSWSMMLRCARDGRDARL